MTKSKKTFFMSALFVFFTVAFSALVLYKQHDRKEIIRVTQTWANLAPFPENAELTLVEKSGSAFSREFRIKFKATEEDIQKWLNISPGTSQLIPSVNGSVEKYSIKPAGGAQFAEVVYNFKTNEIYIRVYWN